MLLLLIGYLLSLNGAKKLLAPNPTRKLVPVDEYLPIMFNKHPDTHLMSNFAPRNLLAFTVDPLFVHPVRYTGQEGYVSDTENAEILDETLFSTTIDDDSARKFPSPTLKDEL